jgi:hypothetical protein
MMQKSTTFTTIFRVKKYYFHYDFTCKKVPLSFDLQKNVFFHLQSRSLQIGIVMTYFTARRAVININR